MDYDHLVLNSQPGLGVQPDPPNAHVRAPLWLAQEAVASGSPQRALGLLQGLPESSDNDVLRIRGKALFALGNYSEAVRAWGEAGDYQSLATAAVSAESDGLYDAAELAYRAGLRVDPTDGTTPLANFLWHVRDNPAAAEQILRVSLSQCDARNLNWLRGLGQVLQAQSRWDEAIAVYKQALNENPDDLYTLYLLGLGYVNGKNDAAGARSIFEHMIALAPSRGDGYFAMGLLAAKEGKPEEADGWFVQAIARSPDDPWIRVVRANTARMAQKLSLALTIYSETVKQFPTYSTAEYERAWAYKLSNQPEQAMASIDHALALMKSPNLSYYLRAGRIYEWAGDDAGALKAYSQALRIDPQNAVARQAVETLTK